MRDVQDKCYYLLPSEKYESLVSKPIDDRKDSFNRSTCGSSVVRSVCRSINQAFGSTTTAINLTSQCFLFIYDPQSLRRIRQEWIAELFQFDGVQWLLHLHHHWHHTEMRDWWKKYPPLRRALSLLGLIASRRPPTTRIIQFLLVAAGVLVLQELFFWLLTQSCQLEARLPFFSLPPASVGPILMRRSHFLDWNRCEIEE